MGNLNSLLYPLMDEFAFDTCDFDDFSPDDTDEAGRGR
jgi:hypothetical protein